MGTKFYITVFFTEQGIIIVIYSGDVSIAENRCPTLCNLVIFQKGEVGTLYVGFYFQQSFDSFFKRNKQF